VPPLRETVSIRDIAQRFLANSNNFLPVVDAQQRLIGMVALQDLKEFLHDNQDLAGVIAQDLMRPPPRCLMPGQRLLDALPLVLESEFRNIPVVNSPGEKRLIGSLSRAQVLAIFSEAIAAKTQPTG
jgi:CIC family chloride channel protein